MSGPLNTLLDVGDAVVTCGVTSTTDAVVAAFGVKSPVYTANSYTLEGDGSYPIWDRPDEIHPLAWSFSNLGNVFGSAIDTARNIYVTASSSFSPQLNFLSQDAAGTAATVLFASGTGTIGQTLAGPNATAELNAAGTIYKLDAVTGQPTVFAQLPQLATTANYNAFGVFVGSGNLFLSEGSRNNTGPGLGNIAYDNWNDQYFVTNFEDGKIYRVAADGTVDLTAPFDFGVPDNGLAGMPPLGDRVWGVAFYEGRVYYSVWTSLICTNGNCGTVSSTSNTLYNNPPNNVKPTIRSVALDPLTGDFLPATDQLEYNGADLAYVSPISDIAFDADGNMLIAQRTMLTDYAGYNHRSQVAYLTGGDGSWTADPFLTGTTAGAGVNTEGTEAYGGVDFGYDGLPADATIWYSSADMVQDADVNNGSQGPHGIAGFAIDDLTSDFPDPRAIIPYDPNSTTPNSVDLKSSGGDVEIAGDCMSLGNLVWYDLNDNGVLDNGESGLEGVTVNLLGSDGATVIATTTTNAQGNYVFPRLFAGDYIVEIVPPAGYFSSTGSNYSSPTGTYEPAPDPDASNTDSDDNGSLETLTIRSEIVSLRETTEPTDDAALAGGQIDLADDFNANYAVDFGLILVPDCDLTITAVTPTCTFDAATGQSTFSLQVDLNFNYPDLLTVSDAIDVTVAGTSMSTSLLATTTGTATLTFPGIVGPADDVLVEAVFANAPSCSASTSVDLIACTPACVDGTDLGGNVFNDFNNDGADAGATEPGQENVLVEIYECDGVTPAYTTYTNADGDWTVPASVTLTYPVRVEFSTPLQDYLQPSYAGDDNGTNVQFVDAPSCEVDYGVIDPALYCNENPLVATTCYINGTAAAQGGGDAIIDFNYDRSGGVTQVAAGSEVGATWGVAYSATDQVLYVSEVLRRHSGTGSGGLGEIYAIDLSSGAPSAPVSLMTVPDVGTVIRDLAASPSQPSADGPAFDGVGKLGIGDIDISSDGTTLYVMNLAQSRVDVIDVATQAVTGSISFPSLGCTLRPWALKVYEGEVYAGAVCEDALQAYVFVADGATFTPVDLNTADGAVNYFDLSYQRESVWSLNPTFSGSNQCNFNQLIPDATQWHTWISAWPMPICSNPFGSGEDYIIYPQPILSDLEFDDDGSIILGFMDRMGMQGGFLNVDPSGNGNYVTISGGDVIRICATADGYAPEGTTGCPQNDLGDDAGYAPEDGGTGVNAALDDGSEYYNGDDWLNGNGNGEHYEISVGGLALRPGSGELVVAVYDPINGSFNAGGVRYLSNATGENLNGFELYGNGDLGTFAKATGIGDVELICDPLPIQIGNYVWIDEDEDGVQDACEPPLVGVPVSLYNKVTMTFVAVDTTGPNGEYYFNDVGSDTTYAIVFGYDANDTSSPWNATDMELVIDGVPYSVTVDSTGDGNNPSLNDSDATLMDMAGLTGYPMITYTVGDTTDHTLDVGFAPIIVCDLSITSVSPVCTYDPTNGQSTFAVTVNVEWNFASLTTNNETISVTFAGQTQTIDPAGSATGTGMVIFDNVAGPAYGLAVEASFTTTTVCSDNSQVDLIACTPDCVNGNGTIGGNVFNDSNNDGADAGAEEIGQENVLVEIYECDSDTPVATTYTNADGNWSVDPTGIMFPVRVEFSTPLQDYLQPSYAGDDNGTNVQFVDAPSCDIDYGVIDRTTYCGPLPLDLTPLGQLSSEGILLSPGVAFVTCGIIEDPNIPVNERYTAALIDLRTVTTAPNRPQVMPDKFHRADWTVDQIGNVFGSAIDTAGNFYATASSHYGAGFGYALGTDVSNTRPAIIQYGQIGGGAQDLGAAGTIYRMDAVTGAPTVFAQLPQQSFAFTHRACEEPYETIDRVSGPGLGNITFDKVNNQFFVSNFEDGAIYQLAPDGTILSSFDPQTLPGFAQDDGTPGFANDFKPYGLTVSPQGDRLYFGVHPVDNDPTTPLTVANVYYVNLTGTGNFSGTEQFVVSTTPDAPGTAYTGDFNAFGEDPAWYSVSDLEFSPNGELVIGHRSGCGDGTNPVYASSHNHGASYFLYDLATGVLTNVQTRYAGDLGNDAVNASDGTGNDDVYGGIGIWNTNDGNFVYAVSSSDIRDELGPHGIMVFPNDFTQTGNGTTEYILQPAAAIPYFNDFATNDFKGVGGDIDVYNGCGLAPIQIGNYVWNDADEDGVQDPCEEPLAGIPVSLYNKVTMTFVAVDTTGPNGEYYFNDVGSDTTYAIVFGYDANDASSSWNATDMELVIDGVPYGITIDSTGEGSNPNFNDSDATLMDMAGLTGYPMITYTVGDTTDHTLDVGFVQLATFDLALRKTIDTDASPGPYEPSDEVTFNLTVFNQGDIGATDIEVTDYLPAGLSYTSVSAGTQMSFNGNTVTVTDNGGGVFTLDTLAPADSLSVSLVLTIDETFMGTELVNYAEITSFDDDNDPTTAPPVDEDSTPGDNLGDDETGTDDNIDDDGIGGNGIPDDPNDADDYDPAVVPVVQTFDLALTKALDTGATPGPFTYGSTVTYSINVINQGSLDATDVVVSDYIPDGLTLVPSATWTQVGETAVLAMPINVAAGETESLSISFTIDADFMGTTINNVAEITAAMNALGLADEDSTPGDNSMDDPEFGSDDEIDDDGLNGNGMADDPNDADDFDFAAIEIQNLSIGSTVFIDANNNGVQDAGEAGIPGVTVEVYAAGATPGVDAPVGTDVTDGNGLYYVDMLVPGDYFVSIGADQFAAGTLATYPLSSNTSSGTFAGETDPDDNVDNDDEGQQAGGSGTAVTSQTVTLAIGEEPTDATLETASGNMQDNEQDANGNMTLDFGFFAPVSLGDTVFVDVDMNDIQSVGDAPLANVTVTVYDNATGMPVDLGADGLAYTATTMTAADGSYTFDNLPPGDYYVVFDLTTGDNNELYDYVTPNVGGDDAVDSDAMPALATDDVAASDPTGFLFAGDNDPTLDAGVVCAIEVEVAAPFTICSTQPIDLLQDAAVTPAYLGGVWTTDGTGTFFDASGNELTAPFELGVAAIYRPSAMDARLGSVTLTLTSGDPGALAVPSACDPVSNSVTIEVLKVDCGAFPTNAGED